MNLLLDLGGRWPRASTHASRKRESILQDDQARVEAGESTRQYERSFREEQKEPGLTAAMARPADPPTVGEFLLGAPLTAGLVILCVVMFAGWLPHYLTWPWWIDLDTLATIAQSWDSGLRPYRDVALFNFPGQIELFWILGKCFGWGHTTPIYALDAALLAGLGLTMFAWSRRCFGRGSPGLVGYVAVLHYYFGLDYAGVAQRDWHAPLLVVVGMMLIQSRTGLGGAIGCGLLFGLAMVIRPHVLLLTPPVAILVLASGAAGDDAARLRGRICSVLGWALGAAMAVAAGFAPLAVQGLLGDFVRGVRQASYGRYGGDSAGFLVKVIGQLCEPRFTLGLIVAVFASIAAPARMRRLMLPWVFALVLALAYGPLHPIPHAYLAHPRWLIWSITLAVITGVEVASKARRLLALGLVVLVLVLASPGLPRYWDMPASLRALGDLGRAGEPAVVPPGAAARFAPSSPISPYTWDQYRQVLAYLRLHTAPHTQVANLLRNHPFPPVNGTVGRISPLRTDAGIMWLYSLDVTREEVFARYLEETDDAVVVWIPGERSFDQRLQLPLLERTVPRCYRPDAQLSGIQVWRRVASPR
jgi:hypothetical protein